MVSIIIPVYNSEKYIAACIESVLGQTDSSIELILVNDGSSDKSGEICDSYAGSDRRVKVIHNENHGVSYSRNAGIRAASGEYIAFCDSDDLYDKTYIADMVSAMEENNADMVICNYAYMTEKSLRIVSQRKSGGIEKEEIYRRIFIDNTIGGFSWNKLFRKSLIEGIEFDSSMQICEDTYFLCKALQKAEKIYYTEKSLYNYRLHPDSVIAGVGNMFTADGKLKYAIVYERLLKEKLVPDACADYVRASECIAAISVKCDYENTVKDRDKQILRELDRIIKRNISCIITCSYIPLKKKVIYICNAMFNLRRLKYRKKGAKS